VKFEKIAAGDVLYDVHSYRMGNTTLRSVGVWDVRIKALREDGAIVSWNGNRDEFWPRTKLSKLRAKMPITVDTWLGGKRLAKRGETGK